MTTLLLAAVLAATPSPSPTFEPYILPVCAAPFAGITDPQLREMAFDSEWKCSYVVRWAASLQHGGPAFRPDLNICEEARKGVVPEPVICKPQVKLVSPEVP